MSELQHLRASRTPLAMACPESTVDDGGPKLGGSGAPADLGSADHGVIKKWIDSGSPDRDDIDHLREFHAVDDHDELASLVWTTWSMWRKVKDWFPDPKTEWYLIEEFVELCQVCLSGTVDLASYVPDAQQVRILDWKTGFVDADASHQLRAYGWLTLQQFPFAETVYACVLRVRDQTIEPFEWTREELTHWRRGLEDRMSRRGSQEFSAGSHCRYCPRSLTCPAKDQLIRQARVALLDLGSKIDLKSGTLNLPDDPIKCGDELMRLMDRVRLLRQVCDSAWDMVGAHVRAMGGTLPTSNGQEIAIAKTEQRPIDFANAWPLLSEHVPEHLWSSVFRVSKTEAEKAVKAELPRGTKGQVWMGLLEQLDQAGALGCKTIEKLVTRKATPAIENQPSSV